MREPWGRAENRCADMPEPGASPTPTQGLRILIVDDDYTTRRVLEELLLDEGFLVASCDCGAAALVLLRASRYDVLLTDLIMPGMSGLELWSAARTLGQPLRCVVMSGHPPLDGVPADVAWVSKPIDVGALLAELTV